MNDEDDNSITVSYPAGYCAPTTDYADDTITITGVGDIDLSDITLNTTPTYSTSVKRSPFDDMFIKKTPEKSVTYDLDIDPLAAIIEIKASGQWPDIGRIGRHIPEKETVELAQNIREYFLDKVITQKLSGQYHDSDFKRDMVKALKLSAKCVIEEPHIRLLYRMDDFYKEDTFKDRIAAEYTTLPDRTVLELKSTPVSYIGSIDVFRRGGKTKEFYFKTNNNYVVVLKSPRGDWLTPITAVFKYVKELWISANARPNKMREHDFIVADLNINYTVDNFVF
jgi:hypothetical protein